MADEDSLDGFGVVQIKNDFSTFIEELQQTTQKLMDEVFNQPYKSQPLNSKNIHERNVGDLSKKGQNYLSSNNRFHTYEDMSQSFRQFLTRSEKFLQNKHKFIQNQQLKRSKIQSTELTFTPSIIRFCTQEQAPLYERCLQLHKSKEKNLAIKRIQKKRQQQYNLNRIPFKPKVHKGPTRTFQQYINHKKKWQENKYKQIQKKKVITAARKYQQCTFQPHLITQKYNSKMLKRNGEKVQDRLLRSLQQSIDRKS